ncbi:MAG: carotenoid biosynthesis protein, partial [Bacteroidota bacterium]
KSRKTISAAPMIDLKAGGMASLLTIAPEVKTSMDQVMPIMSGTPPAFKSIIGAALMVFLDFFIEPSAPTFDFWYWAIGHPPLINYISWFIISFVMHLIYHRYIKGGNLDISKHLYLAQLMFFAFFYVY